MAAQNFLVFILLEKSQEIIFLGEEQTCKLHYVENHIYRVFLRFLTLQNVKVESLPHICFVTSIVVLFGVYCLKNIQ